MIPISLSHISNNTWYNHHMNLVVAPNPVPQMADLFLAGGISNCPDWQSAVVSLLQQFDMTVLNPRRPGHLVSEEAENQIVWEWEAFKRTRTVLFWFPEETLCPITLFELGTFMPTNMPLFIGTHPNYSRRLDVVTQVRLARPDLVVHDNLMDTVNAAVLWHEST